jgi:hypothetical protein
MLRKHPPREFHATSTVAILVIFLAIPTSLYILYRSVNAVSVPYDTLVTEESYYKKSAHPDCHIIQLGAFTIETPDSYRYIRRKGYDSYIGEITNLTDTLYFDYGMYSYNFGDETTLEHIFTRENVHGREAILVRPKRRGRGLTGIYFKNIADNNHLVVSGYDLKDEETAISMFKTVKFK